LDPWAAAVPTQSFLARSKYDAAPGASGATVAAVAGLAAVAAGAATARPATTAALAAKVKKRRPRTMARPSIVTSVARELHIGRLEVPDGGLGRTTPG
jgi:hypothetical protein